MSQYKIDLSNATVVTAVYSDAGKDRWMATYPGFAGYGATEAKAIENLAKNMTLVSDEVRSKTVDIK